MVGLAATLNKIFGLQAAPKGSDAEGDAKPASATDDADSWEDEDGLPPRGRG